jgi:hypothetical protein
MNTKPEARHFCGCCGLPIEKAQGGGLYFTPGGRLHEYLLCGTCAAQRENDPQGVMERVELNFVNVEGEA